jgi:Mor family transcriptional regulator
MINNTVAAGAKDRRARDTLILTDYRQGKPIKDIATEYNLTVPRIYQILKSAGIQFRPNWSGQATQ